MTRPSLCGVQTSYMEAPKHSSSQVTNVMFFVMTISALHSTWRKARAIRKQVERAVIKKYVTRLDLQM